ncbi:MAG: NosD domain-containing protein [Candidatus Saliniplasma sp.]
MTWDKSKILVILVFLLVSVIASPLNHSAEIDGTKEETLPKEESDPSESDQDYKTVKKNDHPSKISHKNRISTLPLSSQSSEQSRKEPFQRTDPVSLNTLDFENGYDSLKPIRINSDDEFIETAEREGWSGDGNPEDPYKIEGYEIDGDENGYGIYIGNVSHDFVIAGNKIYNAEGNSRLYFRDSGIYIYNTSNALIKNNIIYDNRYGLYVHRSSYNTISNNTIFDSVGPGIFLLESDYNDIKKNVMREGPSSEENKEEDLQENSVLVKFEENVLTSSNMYEKEMLLNRELRIAGDHINASRGRVFSSFNAGELKLNQEMSRELAVNILSSMPGVEYAEPNHHVEIMNEPNDAGYPSLWGMHNIDAPGAWNVTTGSEEVVVAVLDTGIDYTHEDLAGNMWEDDEGNHGYNFINDSPDPMDDHGHGTHVAGTIGAVGNNNVGVTGVNWNVSLMGLKFIDGSGSGTVSDAIASLEYVLDKKREGVNVVATSNSWGGSGKSRLLDEAIAEHRDEDILFIAAAGNNNRNIEEAPFYPAGYEHTNMITVGATNREDNKTSFSNYGANSVHVTAPGRHINSTYLDNSYRSSSGTSMATPHVSGLVALLAAHNNSYDHNNLKNIIISTSDRIDNLENKSLSDGRINASSALHLPEESDDINIWVHRPGSSSRREVLTDSNVMVSINDGVNPILDANVTVKFRTGKEKIYLEDDGLGWDQIQGDGYYTSGWEPEVHGEVKLTFTVRKDGWESTKEVSVNVGKEAGISLWESGLNDIQWNEISGNPHGFSLYLSEENQIIGNNLSKNDNGVIMENSNHTTISRNIIDDVIDGIVVRDSNNNSFLDNAISNNIYGIDVYGEGNNTITGNNITDAYFGILLTSSNDNILQENNISDSSFGMDLYNSTRNQFVRNSGYNNTFYLGVWFSNNTLIHDNPIVKCDYGIVLSYTLNSELKRNSMNETGLFISGNELKYWLTQDIDISNTVNGLPVRLMKNETDMVVPSDTGQLILVNCRYVDVSNLSIESTPTAIMIAFSEENLIFDNEISKNRLGIYLYYSNENVVTNNLARNNTLSSIRTLYSNRNSIKDNIVSNGSYAISILSSNRNYLKSNEMKNTGLMLDGSELEHWNSHKIDTNNLVNGEPLYYWKNRTGGSISENVGQVILANSSGVIISDQEFSDLGDAITLGFSDNNTIYNTYLHNSTWAMYFSNSDKNEIKNCVFINNTYGMAMVLSNKNNISSNLYLNNTYGILLAKSDKNDISRNEFYENWRSVYIILDSENNIVYHNNFFKSEREPARDNGFGNRWYKEYPEGGNYWFDHESEDKYSGSGQNRTGGDGIADSPYLGRGFTDEYPLMEPVAPIELSVETPKNNTVLNIADVTVNWTSRGGVGMTEHRIGVTGEEWSDVGNRSHHTFKGLDDGTFSIQIEAIDNTGQRTDAVVVFTVDTTPPDIDMKCPQEGYVHYSRDVLVGWQGSDELSGIDYYEVRINNGEWITVDEDTDYEFTDLRNGEHTAEIRVWDEAGNSNTSVVRFSVFVYNIYVLIPFVVSTILIVSYGLWILFRVPKVELDRIEPYIREYERRLDREYSEYKIRR